MSVRFPFVHRLILGIHKTCRSRAVQISMNLSVLEEWISEMQLPRGVGAHFAPVRDLLTWLQARRLFMDALSAANSDQYRASRPL